MQKRQTCSNDLSVWLILCFFVFFFKLHPKNDPPHCVSDMCVHSSDLTHAAFCVAHVHVLPRSWLSPTPIKLRLIPARGGTVHLVTSTLPCSYCLLLGAPGAAQGRRWEEERDCYWGLMLQREIYAVATL